MSTTSDDAELSVAARSFPPPPYPSPTYSPYSNGGSPQNAASSNGAHQLPRARNAVKQGNYQSQKRGNHFTPKSPAMELGNLASSLQRKSSGVLHSVSVSSGYGGILQGASSDTCQSTDVRNYVPYLLLLFPHPSTLSPLPLLSPPLPPSPLSTLSPLPLQQNLFTLSPTLQEDSVNGIQCHTHFVTHPLIVTD